MSLYGLPQMAGKVLLGIGGVMVLSAGAKAVVILEEIVRRALRQSYEQAMEKTPEATLKNEWQLKAFTPYRNAEDWNTLARYAVANIVVATVTLYLANRFVPSLVTNANSLLHKVVPIQFTPDHIPLTKLVGL